MPRRSLAFVSLCVLGRLLVADASAQDRSVPAFPARTEPLVYAVPTAQPVLQFAARAEAITVDAVVLDKAGQPVSDLSKADFTLLEDGRPQTIVRFDPRARDAFVIDPPVGAASSPSPSAPVPPDVDPTRP